MKKIVKLLIIAIILFCIIYFVDFSPIYNFLKDFIFDIPTMLNSAQHFISVAFRGLLIIAAYIIILSSVCVLEIVYDWVDDDTSWI